MAASRAAFCCTTSPIQPGGRSPGNVPDACRSSRTSDAVHDPLAYSEHNRSRPTESSSDRVTLLTRLAKPAAGDELTHLFEAKLDAPTRCETYNVGPSRYSPSMSDVGSDVISSISAWLAEQGYPLEMRVAHAFQDESFLVTQSDYYTTDDGRPREIDVVARVLGNYKCGEKHSDGLVQFQLCVVCECKSGPKAKKPWVVFSRPTQDWLVKSTAITERMASVSARLILAKAASDPRIQELDLFKIGERCGYALSQAHSNKGDQADGYDPGFGTLIALVNAAKGKSESIYEPPMYLSRVTLPLLVVSTPLVECWLDDAGGMQLAERDMMVLAWNRSMVDDNLATLIHVIHERALPRYVQHVRDAFEALWAKQDVIKKAVELELAMAKEGEERRKRRR